MFHTVSRRASRVLLCQLFKVITKHDPAKSELAAMIEKLNSWDARKTDEPDFLRRLEAFKEINAVIIGSAEPDVDLLLAVVNNCCYFIHNVSKLE